MLGDDASRGYADDARAHLAWCQADYEATVEATEHLATAAFCGWHEPGILTWPAKRASALVRLGRAGQAEAELDGFATLAVQRGRRSTQAALTRVRGELLALQKRPAEASAAFQAAVAMSESADALEQGVIHDAFGRFLRRAGRRRSATEELSNARDIFVGLGAVPFIDRCDAELEACGVSRRGSGPTGVSLTPQEHAVSRLVCEGRTNKQIADELVVSVKTVEYHLGHVSSKFGVTSRTQLAAAMSREGVLALDVSPD
jgi:DNA-binding CsgD family transcriptional regulator